ncbi:DUF124 domain-containing protein [hydrothermal vent metagenome]|uniref:DUF124 domain-containing protein n=1 Tax=hydrothermal vent metagenome TaxID=652676 RepID=A0A1W1BAP9_9ZZZZ
MQKIWYLESDNGQKAGPVDRDEALAFIKDNPKSYAWREGFDDWKSVLEVEELSGISQPSAPPSRVTHGHTNRADEIEYEIFGQDTQYVEIILDPNESAISEAGAMMYKDSSIEMDTVFGDGSGSKADTGGFIDKLVGAGRRLISGESLFITLFTHTGTGKAKVAFAAPYPGHIIPVDLSKVGGALICQKDCFLCAAKGVSIDLYIQKKILTGLFGGEGFIMQKLEGDGMAFIHAGGTLKEITLKEGETLHLDTGCLVAMEPQVKFDITQAGNIKTALFGGEGFFFAKLRGPGKVWIQSLPFSRLAGRMLTAAPQSGGKDKGEGSALGIIGDMIMGDR